MFIKAEVFPGTNLKFLLQWDTIAGSCIWWNETTGRAIGIAHTCKPFSQNLCVYASSWCLSAVFCVVFLCSFVAVVAAHGSVSCLCADKISSTNPRVIEDAKARQLCSDVRRCSYFETCATYGLNVNRVFTEGKAHWCCSVSLLKGVLCPFKEVAVNYVRSLKSIQFSSVY